MFKRLQTTSCSQYLGLDISAAAIEKARAMGTGPFICADAEHFVPTDTYDVIIFNESLYYFLDPVATVVRYSSALRPDGIMIVSTFLSSRRGRAILRALKRKFAVVDETSIAHAAQRWTCSVLAPSPRACRRGADHARVRSAYRWKLPVESCPEPRH